MIETTRAIVFSSLKYAEADLIVTCFTRKSGLKTYLLRGVLKSRKGKLKASYFLPLTQLEIVASHKNKGTLESIREAKVYNTYQSLHTNIVKSSLALFLAEMLKNSIQEEEMNPRLFDFIEASLQWLDHHEAIANFHILFLLKLTEHLGCYPDTSEIELPYFNLAEGQFQNEDISIYSEMSERVDNFKRFIGINFDNSLALKLTKKARLDVLNLVLEYYQLHLHGYKKPKSLAVLNQLFNQ
ncbi:DNA repair protein RecO [Patiriisocius marinistellae]|uniref:DNA repair protein RecO n=1 Tax=Patiriisocius marinistellae TaxID=2494560 RepID=A0A5J4FTS3_9FLAO|nr:DNA repair protein RecO [Patiriisocius marinistellae]GEQ85043.1 DNA repair protein RecO [Patiriisocius marinistellae]